MTSPLADTSTTPQLVDAALADPAGMRSRLEAIVNEPASDTAEARWALGLALRELDDLPGARQMLQQAVARAQEAGRVQTAASISSSLALVLLRLGEIDAALAATDEAATHLDGAAAARNLMQRGLVLQRLGRHEESLQAYTDALPGIQAAGDLVAEARLLGNRGVLRTYLGQHQQARADLERAVQLAQETGQEANRAGFLHNLGFIAGRQGDVPEALSFLDRAETSIRAVGASGHLAVLEADRAEILADAGLIEEAVERAAGAVATLAETGDRTSLAEAWLLQARMHVLAGMPEEAAMLARRARQRFQADARHGWQLQARYVELVAALDGGRDVVFDEVDDLAAALAGGGWMAEARAARVSVAQRALAADEVVAARRLLRPLRQPPKAAPALARAQHWHATALLRAATGQRAGARRAVRAGLDVLHQSRVVFGSAELRAHAAAHGAGLVELAVRMALEDGRPTEALVALDHVRATDDQVHRNSLRDAGLAADLAVLRDLEEQQREHARSGADVRAIATERVRIERRIRDRARQLPGAADADRAPRLSVKSLREALFGRTLVAYFRLDGDLHLLAVGPRSTRHLRLGPAEEIQQEIAHVRAALRRLAYGRGSPAALAAADASLALSSKVLRGALGFDVIDPSGLVVVPTAALTGLPWGLVASGVAEVPSVVPSAQAWLRLQQAEPTRSDAVVLAAGPDLPGADREIRKLGTLHPDATVLVGRRATAQAVRAAMEGAGTVHISAHGSFRTDNPLFSSLRFADGPVTVYELETLRQSPTRVVLSSCEAAATRSVGGDAVLGLSTALLRMGVRTLIAPVLEIPDEATEPMMFDMHQRLQAGRSSGEALAAAIAAAGQDTPQERAVRASFVVMGC